MKDVQVVLVVVDRGPTYSREHFQTSCSYASIFIKSGMLTPKGNDRQ